MALTWLNQAARAEDTIWISSLDLGKARQGWGKTQANRSVTEKTLSIGGKTFERGLGTHAPGCLWLELKGQAVRFQAQAGVDDAAGAGRGSVRFEIIGDDRVLWKSGILKSGQAAVAVDVGVKGIQKLALVVGDGGDGADFDHADWAEAKLTFTGQRPVAIDPPRERPVILTPHPPASPRINGAKVFGVRPGSPFLFTIPATGERPLRFSARGLPPGLVLNRDNGQITGTIRSQAPRTYPVSLRAANRHGTARRDFRIVVGDRLALTPHMGWNSWYIWENHVTDQIMRDAADAMVETGLINHGFMYVNIDDCWAVKPGASDPALGGAPRDAQRRVNCNRRFPDMKALTDYIHAKGLKAGIYTSPGPTTCAGHVGAYQHEEIDARTFVDWGFDFLKYDWCSYGNLVPKPGLPEFKKPYQQMGDILKRQKRDIVLNLCQYGMGDVWQWGQQVGGHSWRTAGDLGLTFEGIATGLFRDGFDVYARNELHNYGGPGAWNDPDYLLIGYLSNWKGQTAPSPLTPNEQYTHVSLWCLVAAPLILSGDITRLDDFTLSLLSNDEVLAVDQDPLGRPGRRMVKTEDLEVWAKDLEDGSKAVGLFNRGEATEVVSVKWSDLGLTGPQKVRDLWRQQDLGVYHGVFEAPVGRHGVVLVRLQRAK
jgi:alpha-galactosidase